MKAFNMTEVLKNAPVGEWLALSPSKDRIIASSPDLEVALNAAKELGEDNPVMMKAPSPYALVL